jgi:hypothetical protein
MFHRSAAVLAVVVLSSSFAAAQTLTVEHTAVGCVVADKHPRFEARFTPGDAVAKAKVLFQPKDTARWYAVAMKREGPVFHGVLPKPKKSLEAFRYYIEVTDKAASTSRTPDQTATVVDSAAECQDKMMAGALGSASVALEVPGGAPAVPAGFAGDGLSVAAGAAATESAVTAASAGGGFPTAVVIGVAGAAAAGGAVLVAKGSGGSEPAKKTYSGSFNGEYTVTSFCFGGTGSNTCTRVFAIAGNATVTLEEGSDGSVKDVSGLQLTGTQAETRITGSCTPIGTSPFGRFCKLGGPAGALTCRQENETATRGSAKQVFEFSGALAGGALTGNARLDDRSQDVDPNPNCSTSNQTGSAQFPLNLR